MGARARTDADADAAMDRYAAGDDAAFAELYDRVAPRLHAYLLRRTRDVARTEDLVQQTFLHVHRARGRFVPGAEVLPWMYAIAYRLMIDDARRSGREAPMPADHDVPEGGGAADAVLEARRMASKVDEALARMPEKQRVAFELVKQEGLSMREAAEALGTTVASVKLRTHRAYLAIRGALGDAPGKEA